MPFVLVGEARCLAMIAWKIHTDWDKLPPEPTHGVAMLRSVIAVLVGIITLTVLSFAIEAAMDPLLLWLFPHALPDQAALGLNPIVRAVMFIYGAASIIAGGYVTAWLARRAPVGHALAMGFLQCALTFYAMLSLTKH